MRDNPSDAQPPDKDAKSSCPQPAQFDFDALAQGGKEVLIRHAGQLYRLRLTRNGKLILNK